MKFGVQPVPEDGRIFNRPSNKRSISEFFEKELPEEGDAIKCPYCGTKFEYNGRYYELQECPDCKLLI